MKKLIIVLAIAVLCVAAIAMSHNDNAVAQNSPVGSHVLRDGQGAPQQ